MNIDSDHVNGDYDKYENIFDAKNNDCDDEGDDAETWSSYIQCVCW